MSAAIVLERVDDAARSSGSSLREFAEQRGRIATFRTHPRTRAEDAHNVLITFAANVVRSALPTCTANVAEPVRGSTS